MKTYYRHMAMLLAVHNGSKEHSHETGLGVGECRLGEGVYTYVYLSTAAIIYQFVEG
jgi:hypothetical protein